jgi:hypothetical protein
VLDGRPCRIRRPTRGYARIYAELYHDLQPILAASHFSACFHENKSLEPYDKSPQKTYASGVVLRRLFRAIGAVAAAQPCLDASRSFTGRLSMEHINLKYSCILSE